MKLEITRYVYEPPALAIVPETEYEAAVLARYWLTAELTTGMEDRSSNGYCYQIKFREPPGEEK